MKKLTIRTFAVLAALSLALISTPVVFAKDGETHSGSSGSSGSGSSGGSSGSSKTGSSSGTNPATPKPEDSTASHHSATSKENEAVGSTEQHSGLDDKTTESKDKSGKRLETAKLKVCEQRTKDIDTIMTRGVTRAQKQIDLFKTISTRVEAFYAKEGHVLSNYDALVTAVNAAHDKAQADLDALKTSSFSCNSNDPHNQASDFKNRAAALRDSLKVYRTAVKNLISGVKSVQPAKSDNSQEVKQ